MANVDWPRCTSEDHRSGLQVLGWCAWKVSRIERSFGSGDVAGGLDEVGELGVGDLVWFDPKPVNTHLVDGPFLGVMMIRAHCVGLSRNPAEIGTHVGYRRPPTGLR